MTSWLYGGKPFEPELIGDHYGFVYSIRDRDTGKRYIGKKCFRNTKTLPPLKGQKRKRRTITESDWRDYVGSNGTLKALVEKYGRERFEREILRLCRTASEASYFEAKLQFEFDVLLSDDFHNDQIMVRINRSHLKHLK
ncbi:hypothetical protein [Sinorhizobium meliloti]|uniref:hypothetical protein n=1 Tax=Rhizobium meliloti TaxID=382 RepID=UPI0001E4EB1A|nr:hypothetical protein [Sinorhizobium meliloti]AEG09269.1 hypothetical protein SinmeB_5013 [Sinorhizobium meliloti BL225C]MDE4548754.1 hypothetical protein [Sinorhizobium meliloti]MDE4570552.1 hypothetical protein [Sinorhizobium meliloti]SDZ02343.1 hypothetical protein SAMN04244576_04662 [Sinorhizobium meliloti]